MIPRGKYTHVYSVRKIHIAHTVRAQTALRSRSDRAQTALRSCSDRAPRVKYILPAALQKQAYTAVRRRTFKKPECATFLATVVRLSRKFFARVGIAHFFFRRSFEFFFVFYAD